MTREMATHRGVLSFVKWREEKKDPNTTHPLSFEEFDSIPDIGDLTVEDEK